MSVHYIMPDGIFTMNDDDACAGCVLMIARTL